MFYLPGSYVVGRVVRALLAFELWGWGSAAADWDEHEIRGAGSLTILLVGAAAVGGGVWWAVHTWL